MTRNPFKLSPLWMAAVVAVLSVSCRDQGSAPVSSTTPLESYVESELFCLEETYRILDRYSQELWPGWKNYAKIPVKVNYPNGVVLFVGPLPGGQPGFERIAGRTVSGKAVYVNRRKRTSVEVRPPLFAQRARGGKLIEVFMALPGLPLLETERSAALEAILKEKSRPEAPFDLAPLGDSDSRILTYIHEHFHGYKIRFPNLDVSGEAALRLLKVDAEYAAWSHIEGLALRRAYVETEDAEAREYLKDFVVSRQIRRTRMPVEAVDVEANISLSEGLSSYVSLKTAILIKNSSDKPGIDRAKDPFFYNYAYLDGYLDNIMRKGMDYAVALTEDKHGKYYFYGAYQCFLLDRFAPGWKRGFLEKRRNLDSALAELLKLTPKEIGEVRKRFSTRYPMDEIVAFHENALKKK